jgi:uncharacterized protein YpiB (UPF0302 family)
MKTLKIGDWVQGKTVNDEFYRRYIEAINEDNHTAIIRVIKCSNNNKAIGKAAITLLEQINHLEKTNLQEEGYLLNLIDVSLLTKDKKWFIELTNRLKQINYSKSDKNAVYFTNNRLGTYGRSS